MWPYSSKKYIQLALIWSFIIHLILIFFIVGTPKNISKKTNVVPTIYLNKHSEQQAKLDLPDSNTLTNSITEVEQTDSQNSRAALPNMPTLMDSAFPEKQEYDTPAMLASELNINDIEDLPNDIQLEKPLLVIKLWIDHTGLIVKTKILSTQLDEQATKKLATKIGSQYFIPAIKDQRGVSSTKIYEIGAGHLE